MALLPARPIAAAVGAAVGSCAKASEAQQALRLAGRGPGLHGASGSLKACAKIRPGPRCGGWCLVCISPAAQFGCQQHRRQNAKRGCQARGPTLHDLVGIGAGPCPSCRASPAAACAATPRAPLRPFAPWGASGARACRLRRGWLRRAWWRRQGAGEKHGLPSAFMVWICTGLNFLVGVVVGPGLFLFETPKYSEKTWLLSSIIGTRIGLKDLKDFQLEGNDVARGICLFPAVSASRAG